MHLAQQGLSASIRRLEEQLLVELFVRDTRKVALTSAGQVLVEGAGAVVAAAGEALEQVWLVSEGRTGRLRVGFSTAAGGIDIARRIMRAFAEQAPDVDLRTHEHDFSDPSAGLGDGEFGVAFMFGPAPIAGLTWLTLVEEMRLLAVRPEHELADRGMVTVEDLGALPWLQLPAPAGPWTEFWFPRPRLGASGPAIRTADEWVTAIEAGRGVAFTLPTVMRDFASARLTLIPVEELPPASVLLAWRVDDRDPLVSQDGARAPMTRRAQDTNAPPGIYNRA